MRAYADAAEMCLARAPLVTMEPALFVSFRCDYAQYNRLPPLVKARGGAVTQVDFADGVTAHICVPPAALPALEEDLRALASGEPELTREGGGYVQRLETRG